MKNKKIKLLIIISLLLLISLFIPFINGLIKENNEKKYQSKIESIKNGLEKWALDNKVLLPDNNNVITFTLDVLKQEKYIDYNLKNPKTDKCFPDDLLLTIKNNNGNYLYEVIENSGDINHTCEDYDNLNPVLILNGNVLEYVDLNSNYTDPFVVARFKDKDISNNVSKTIKNNGQEVSNIDTTKPSLYNITYSVTYNDKTVSIERTIIVKDMSSPNLVVPENTSLSVEQYNSFDVMKGVSATDNSGEVINVTSSGNLSNFFGKYTIVYTAIDSSGNVSTKKRVISVVDKIFEIIAKDSFYSIHISADNDIFKTYFNVNNFGYQLESSSCVDSSSNKIIKNTAGLDLGEYNIICTINSSDGKSSSAKTTIKVNPKIASDMLKDSVVTSLDGLYKDSDNIYRYKGRNPNNYIMLDNELYRILSIEEQGIKVIKNEIISEHVFDAPVSRNVEENTYCINNYCNIWSKAQDILQNKEQSEIIKNGDLSGTVISDSKIYHYLNEEYFTKLTEIEKHIKKDATWNVGAKNDWTWTGKIGIISYDEYINAFLSNNNWLNINKSIWTLTPVYNSNNNVWSINNDGTLKKTRADEKLGIRPVFYLSSNITLSGSGVIGDEYKIVD